MHRSEEPDHAGDTRPRQRGDARSSPAGRSLSTQAAASRAGLRAPASATLALQRAAGNHAVASLVGAAPRVVVQRWQGSAVNTRDDLVDWVWQRAHTWGHLSPNDVEQRVYDQATRSGNLAFTN